MGIGRALDLNVVAGRALDQDIVAERDVGRDVDWKGRKGR